MQKKKKTLEQFLEIDYPKIKEMYAKKSGNLLSLNADGLYDISNSSESVLPGETS